MQDNKWRTVKILEAIRTVLLRQFDRVNTTVYRHTCSSQFANASEPSFN
jgi:hypothetical protein